jgi:VanZ family protein
MTPKHLKILFRVLFFVYLAMVLLLCFGKFNSVPSVPLKLFGIPTDKLVHFCMFFPFPILSFLAFDRFTESVSRTLLFTGITLAAGILLALFTEWGQACLINYRSGDLWDLFADVIALILSSLLVIFLDIRKQK